MTAPRTGPDIRSQVMGGPAWSSVFSSMPGITSRAMAMVLRTGRDLRTRSRASRLASSIRLDMKRLPPCAESAQPIQQRAQAIVAGCRRAPVHVHHRHALSGQGLGEGADAGVDRHDLTIHRLDKGLRRLSLPGARTGREGGFAGLAGAG